MKRSKHSLSNYKLLTCDFGQLVPVGLFECLPGDTFQHSTSLLLRLSPLMAPVMHPVSVRLHHWFVPNRMLWDDWEDFITGGPTGTGSGGTYPTSGAGFTPTKGDLFDYMGVPVGRPLLAGQLSMLPIRAYNHIFNEWYRDEDLVSEVAVDNSTVQRIAWEKDYFTTARPWSQKGPAVTLPIGASAPVVPDGDGKPKWSTEGLGLYHQQGVQAINWSATPVAGSQNPAGWHTTALRADLASAVPPDIIDVRRAFALQRYQEARAQYGSRYTEYLRYLGVRSSDARLQRPEYLGGGKQTIAFSEVLRTGAESNATDAPIGEMKGHGISALRSNRYRYFCEEHGYILTLLSIRPRTMYTDGIARTWSRRTKEDYYQKELELIGQQEVLNKEVYLGGVTADETTFGFQDRYAEYRHEYSSIAGDFRDTLDYWHMARKFATLPTLNGSFIECDPTKRIFAEQTAHSCWIMCSHSVQARRLVGKRTIGRVI